MGERSKESIYDDQIGPLLRQAGQIAKQYEIDLIAVVDIGDEDDPYAVAVTRSIGPSPQATLGIVNHASRSAGNIDKMMMGIVREQKDKPHGSIVIKILAGIDPEADTTDALRAELLRLCDVVCDEDAESIRKVLEQ